MRGGSASNNHAQVLRVGNTVNKKPLIFGSIVLFALGVPLVTRERE